MAFADSNVLITGGLGFIGSTLARRLVGLGANVTILDNLFPDYGGNRWNVEGVGDQIRIEIGDVRDTALMQSLVSGQDLLVNLAGQTSHWDSMLDPIVDLDINARAQLCILEAVRNHNPGLRIVFAGTRQVYGRPETIPVSEDHPLAPVDVNGINKLAGEQFHLLYDEVHGVRSTVLRLTNVIGPRMRIKDARQTFVGVWLRDLLRGDPFEVWGGDQLRDFIDVEDAVDAFLLAAEALISPVPARDRPRVYNVGKSDGVSLHALARQLVEIHGSGAFRLMDFPEDRRAIDIGSYTTDATRIERTLGWKPKIELRRTLARTLDYYRENLRHYA
jgi:UDP-glucose 4-epimerase